MDEYAYTFETHGMKKKRKEEERRKRGQGERKRGRRGRRKCGIKRPQTRPHD
jgi:hypothetical protein